MASPACHSLPRILPDLPHHPLPRLSLFPLPPPSDPLLPHNFFLSPSPPLSNPPFPRNVFDDSLCSLPVLTQELDCPAISAESSASSCFMSSNSDDDNDDDESGSTSSSSLSQLSSPPDGPLDNLTSLCAALPIKRGLSLYFSGKSQSFSSLARVSSVADLAKPENPFVKRQRTRLGADSLHKHHSFPPRCASSAGISKRPTTSSRYKSLKSMPRAEDDSLDGHVKSKPSKCFSVPEFQSTVITSQ